MAKLNELGKDKSHYVEPFVGGGSILFEVLREKKQRTIINDKDLGISSLWKAIRDKSELFKQKVFEFKPSVEEFYRLKEKLEKEDGDVLELGFAKLAIHQISYSGLGMKSGGPLGGKKQESKYKIDCRWSPRYISKCVENYTNKLQDSEIFAESYENFLIDNKNTLIYLDPPYYQKGNELYYKGFAEEEHEFLSNRLKALKYSSWVLSYDDCDVVRDLYRGCNMKELTANYTINTARKKGELLIWG